MSIDANTEGQAPNESQPQEGTPQGQAPDGTSGTEPTGSDLSVEDAKKVIADLRAEAARNRQKLKQLDELERFKADTEAAQMTEAEKAAATVETLTKQTEALADQVRTAKLETLIAVEAGGMGLVDPDTALALIDRTGIEYTDDGTPNADTVKQALQSLVEAKPFLKATTPASTGGATNPGRSAGMSINEVKAMTPEQLAALPPEQFNAALAAIGGSQ